MKYIYIAALLFLCPMVVFAASDHLTIGQIQANGATSDDEFIEIINPTELAAGIGAWSVQYKSASGSTFYKKNFPKGASVGVNGTYIVCGKDYAGACDMKHSSFSLSSAGGTVFLVSNQALITSASSPNIVDQKTYGANETPAETTPTPPLGQERNEILKQADMQRIVINEFMPAPINGAEWIEFYNPTGYAVDLAGWTIADGTGRNFITLSDLLLPTQFKVLELASEHLNNDGDLIILRDANKTEVDAIAYGDWDNDTSAAPVGLDGIAIARIGDGRDTNINNADFALTTIPTPGAKNIISYPSVIPAPSTTPARAGVQKQNEINLTDLKWLTDLFSKQNDEIAKLLKADNVIIINNLYIGDGENSPPKVDQPLAGKITTKTASTAPAVTTKTTAAKTTTVKTPNTAEGQIIAPVGLTGKDMAIVREADRSVEVRLPKDLKTQPVAGDTIKASGSWSTAQTLTLPRLLVKTATAFSVTDHGAPPEPIKISMSALDEHIGKVVEISGTIVEKQPTRFRLADGDKSVLIKSAFAGARDDKVSATGLVTKSGSDYFLTPLGPESLGVIKPDAPANKSIVETVLPYAIAIVPAGILVGAIKIGKRMKKKKGGDSP